MFYLREVSAVNGAVRKLKSQLWRF